MWCHHFSRVVPLYQSGQVDQEVAKYLNRWVSFYQLPSQVVLKFHNSNHVYK